MAVNVAYMYQTIRQIPLFIKRIIILGTDHSQTFLNMPSSHNSFYSIFTQFVHEYYSFLLNIIHYLTLL